MVSALGIAIYGMFLAIIIPSSKTNRVVLGVVLAAMLLSLLLKILPVLNRVSDGFAIILVTVAVAGVAAYFYPVEEED